MYEIYKINETDNLKEITEKYKTTEDELIKINGEDLINKIIPNNLIIVPKNKNTKYDYYTVKKEDNIYQIANNNNVDYNTLLKINGLDKDDYIYPNQTIMLPRKDKNTYLTKEKDTLNKIIKDLNIDINTLIKENDEIFLEEEQIIFF